MIGSNPANSSSRNLVSSTRKEEKDEIVQLQKSAQLQAFDKYLTNASDILNRYEKYVNRTPETETSKRCAELEVINKDLQQKCQYLSMKMKSLQSAEAKEVPLAQAEMPQIEIPDEHGIAVPDDIEIEPKLKTTFTCDYCTRVFARKFNLRIHIMTCKAKLILQPSSAKNKIFPCKICKKKFVSRRKVSTHLWSMINKWEGRALRGAHSKLSLAEHKMYRDSLLKQA